MYGFVLHIVATVVMVFNLSADSMWPQLWWIGGLMLLVGGYWFWFFIRVDVAAEGSSRVPRDARGSLRPVAARERHASA